MAPFEVTIIILLLVLGHISGYPFLLFANRKDIRIIDVERPKSNTTTVAKDLDDAAALDFMYRKNKICWSDISLALIKCIVFDPSTNHAGPELKVVTTGIAAPDGLACDWINENLYWTDSEINRIEVSTLNGYHRKVLFWQNIDQPRAIALVPSDGLMFWTDWGETPKIERAGLNGDPQSRVVIVNETIYWPNGLTVDYVQKVLYWADAKLLLLSSVDFYGGHRKTVVQGKLAHPFSLTVFQDKLYWTDWNSKSIHMCDKKTGKERKPLLAGSISPLGIHVWDEHRQPLSVSPCTRDNGGCSHLCLASPTYPHYTCACPTGVKLLNKKKCADGAQELLLLARRVDIRRISLDTPDYTDVVLPLVDIKHTIAIDYDPVDGRVYWTDDEVRALRRAYLNGTNQEDIIRTEVSHPDGIAVDWIARNLYWTDTGTDRIEVARLNGSSRRVLLSEDLDEPRAIALDPEDGYMYWTDWGSKPKIERAALDGSQRMAIVNSSLGWPNGIALDLELRKVFWCDAQTDRIEVVDMDGKNRKIVLNDRLPHVFGFTLLGNYLYWTDWQRRSIERIHKITGNDRMAIIDLLPDLMGLKAVNVTMRRGWNPCARNNGGCSHLCLNRPSDYVCGCPFGYELKDDLKTCIIPEAFLLFTRKEDIRRISLERNHQDTIIPVTGIKEASALDFDIVGNRIYWTDISLKSISRAFVNGSQQETVIEFGLDYPEGMAVDWIAKNLYWTDTGSNRIEVSRLNGKSRKVLIWKELENPRSLALDPRNGFMYWSNWGSTRAVIEKSSLMGRGRMVVVTDSGRANGLTVDFVDNRLYWIDTSRMTVEYSGLDGRNRITVIGSGLPHPYGLTLYQNYIFWTDWSDHSIERADKNNGSNRVRVKGQFDYIVDILAFHASRQSGWNPCADSNNGCEHLCLAGPASQHYSVLAECSCPAHYLLDSADNKTCHPPRSFLLYSQKQHISRLVLDVDDCPDIVLPLKSLKNIVALGYDINHRIVYWFDGRTQTIKRAYENGTHLGTFVSNPSDSQHLYDMAFDPYSRLLYWSCSRNNVINVTRLDGTPVGVVVGGKGRGDKPRSVALHPQLGWLFWTNFIGPPEIMRCYLDGSECQSIVNDIGNPSGIAVDHTEHHLYWADVKLQRIERSDLSGQYRTVLVDSNVHHPASLAVHQDHLYWIDKDQNVIERVHKRDGGSRTVVKGRVPQLSDLLAVTDLRIDHWPCAPGQHQCSHLCLVTEHNTTRCACPNTFVLKEDGITCGDAPPCSSTEFACRTGVKCIPLMWRCDGQYECQDESDEMNCPDPCRPQEFRCLNGECINREYECDNLPHCSDGSDEHCCAAGMWYCRGSQTCLPSSELCNGIEGCGDGSDESPSACGPQSTSNYSYIVWPIVGVGVLVAILALYFICRRKVPLDFELEARGRGRYPSSNSTQDCKPLHPSGSLNQQTHTNGFPARFKISSDPMCTLLPMNDQPFDRPHITGASSSSSSSTKYPRETLNPPPSPVTDIQPQSYCCSSHTLRSYRHYKTRNRPPPPSPCSTDVNDESDSYGPCYHAPYPPPPSPRSQVSHFLSDETSCPPSPLTERSFFAHNTPPGPAPSPIQVSDY